mgnify:CR=1 FL=1
MAGNKSRCGEQLVTSDRISPISQLLLQKERASWHVLFSLICQIWYQTDRLLFLFIHDLGINLSGRNILLADDITRIIIQVDRLVTVGKLLEPIG